LGVQQSVSAPPKVESVTPKAAAAAPSSTGRGRGRPRRSAAKAPQAVTSPKVRKARKINSNNRNDDEEMKVENIKVENENQEIENQIQNSEGGGELHTMQNQIFLKEEFLKKLNGLINDRNFVID